MIGIAGMVATNAVLSPEVPPAVGRDPDVTSTSTPADSRMRIVSRATGERREVGCEKRLTCRESIMTAVADGGAKHEWWRNSKVCFGKLSSIGCCSLSHAVVPAGFDERACFSIHGR